MFEWAKKTWGKIKDRVQNYFGTKSATESMKDTTTMPENTTTKTTTQDTQKALAKAQELTTSRIQDPRETARKVADPKKIATINTTKKDVQKTLAQAQEVSGALKTSSRGLNEAARKVADPITSFRNDIKRLDTDIAKKQATLKDQWTKSLGTQEQKKDKVRPLAKDIVLLKQQKAQVEKRLEQMIRIQEKLHTGAKTYSKTASKIEDMATQLAQKVSSASFSPSPTPKGPGSSKNVGRD